MAEMNLKSIADLEQVTELTDGDYLLTVSGGVGKLLPAGNFTGGGGGACSIFNTVAAGEASDGMAQMFAVDDEGNPITDAAIGRNAILSGTVRFKTEMEGMPSYLEPDAVVDYGEVLMCICMGLAMLANYVIVVIFGDPSAMSSVEGISL